MNLAMLNILISCRPILPSESASPVVCLHLLSYALRMRNCIINANIYKFYHKHINSKLPSYFQNIDYNPERPTHHYNTRTHEFVYLVKHEFARKSLKYIIPKLICNTPHSIKDKLYTHSLEGFNLYVKTHYLNSYTFVCDHPLTCYSCQITS